MPRIHRPFVKAPGPTEVFELYGGPLDGQRWELSAGTFEFGMATRPGIVSLYHGFATAPGRLEYRGDRPASDLGCRDEEA